MTEPFEDSRRLTGCNLYFDGSGAALESARGLAFDDGHVRRWRDNIADARQALGWPAGEVYARRHGSGVSLAFEAPLDQLYTATEAGEWAWYQALGLHAQEQVEAEGDAGPRPHAGALGREQALTQLRALATAEANPALRALHAAANARGLPFLPDDDELSIGTGQGSHRWPVAALPAVDAVPWDALRAIPAALVTGSNGKTTTVRLLAAMLRAHGLHTAYSCTEGVYFDQALIEGGDFSGPGGARAVLRQPGAQAAVLETARGGLLRRGLALCCADVAIVTNISADHYGEYGVHGLDDLAAVKLVVARAVRNDGLLVLNADDPTLVRWAEGWRGATGWFALDHEQPRLVQARSAGAPTCAVRDGQLVAVVGGVEHALGDVAAMPASLAGRAAYNIANLGAASLGALQMGVPAAAVAAVLARFGNDPRDNPGRLQSWRFGDMRVVVDYAHNPDGLHGLMRAVGADTHDGRMTLVLGHAGNREDDDLRAVAAAAAAYRPARVVLKDIHGYERGRAAGEVAAIMRQALHDAGVAENAIETRLEEVDAALALLTDARAGDLVVLPLPAIAAREAVVAVLDAMHARQWRPGDPLPEREQAPQEE